MYRVYLFWRSWPDCNPGLWRCCPPRPQQCTLTRHLNNFQSLFGVIIKWNSDQRSFLVLGIAFNLLSIRWQIQTRQPTFLCDLNIPDLLSGDSIPETKPGHNMVQSLPELITNLSPVVCSQQESVHVVGVKFTSDYPWICKLLLPSLFSRWFQIGSRLTYEANRAEPSTLWEG